MNPEPKLISENGFSEILQTANPQHLCASKVWCHIVYSRRVPPTHTMFPFHSDVHSLLVLGPEDGLSALANTARSLCESVQQHRTAVSEIDSSLINNKLIGTQNECYVHSFSKHDIMSVENVHVWHDTNTLVLNNVFSSVFPSLQQHAQVAD